MLSANQVASVIISRAGKPLSGMTLQKLLYYVQAWHLAVTGQPLFTEKFKAWVNGPVVPQVWHKRREDSTGDPREQDLAGIDLESFSSDLIDVVLSDYGSMSAYQLSERSHQEKPWRDARGQLPPTEPSDTPLSEMSMAEFYRSSRTLSGQTAADISSGGFAGSHAHSELLDIDALLERIPQDVPDDPWGGANLAGFPELNH